MSNHLLKQIHRSREPRNRLQWLLKIKRLRCPTILYLCITYKKLGGPEVNEQSLSSLIK